MATAETSGRPNIPQTGPEPLGKDDVEIISYRLKESRIGIWKRARLTEQQQDFGEEGAFHVTAHSPHYSLMYDLDIFWSKYLLEIDPTKNTLQISREYGSLRVCDPATRRVRAIIPASELRRVAAAHKVNGVVTKSGFVFSIDFPPYRQLLDSNERLTPKELERMLLDAEKITEPQSRYRVIGGFAKVDPTLYGTKVLILPFEASFPSKETEEVMRRDAVVIDVAKRQLIPRTFLNIPKSTTR